MSEFIANFRVHGYDGQVQIVGSELNVELWYPRTSLVKSIVVQLMDVRAVDDLRISYDYERDGWRVGMDRKREAAGYMDLVEEDVEVAFIPAWLTEES